MEIAALTAGLMTVVVAIAAWTLRRRLGHSYHLSVPSFPCRVELVGGVVPGLRTGRARRVTASWCHTALLLRRHGLGLDCWVLGVHFPTGSLEPAGPEGRRLGADAVTLTLQLDQPTAPGEEQPRLRLVARRQDAELLVGPFLAAGVGAGGGPG